MKIIARIGAGLICGVLASSAVYFAAELLMRCFGLLGRAYNMSMFIVDLDTPWLTFRLPRASLAVNPDLRQSMRGLRADARFLVFEGRNQGRYRIQGALAARAQSLCSHLPDFRVHSRSHEGIQEVQQRQVL